MTDDDSQVLRLRNGTCTAATNPACRAVRGEPSTAVTRRALGLLLVALLTAVGPAAAGDSIGYASVAAARRALTARSDTIVREVAGWAVIEEVASEAHSRWSFAPVAHPAYPAVVRRDVLSRDGVPTLVTWFLCEGRRAPCEGLYTRLRRGGAGDDAALAPVP